MPQAIAMRKNQASHAVKPPPTAAKPHSIALVHNVSSKIGECATGAAQS